MKKKSLLDRFCQDNPDISSLIRAVYTQLECESEKELFDTLADVRRCFCGANGGFSGFTMYNETMEFYRRNRKEILECARGLADSLGEKSVIGIVMQFKSLSDFTEDEIGRALYGRLEDALYYVYDAMAKFALEEVASRANGYEHYIEEEDD